MLIRVNKKINSRNSVKYATVSTGTISHVWYDEDSSSVAAPKRRNRIRLTHDSSLREKIHEYDA